MLCCRKGCIASYIEKKFPLVIRDWLPPLPLLSREYIVSCLLTIGFGRQTLKGQLFRKTFHVNPGLKGSIFKLKRSK